MTAFTPLDSAAAHALLSARYAPGVLDAEAFAVAYLPYGSELPDWSEDEWDGVFVMQSREDVTLLAWRRAAQPEQLTLW